MSVADPNRVRLVAFDLDGCVWRGEQVLAGAREALEDVADRGLELRYVTNNATAHRRAVSDRLSRLGMPAGTERVLTSGSVTALWLRARLLAGAPVMVLGEAGLLEELAQVGLDAYHASVAAEERSATPAAVVVGMDRGLSYGSLAAAQAAIRAGALYVATNPDPTFPTAEGEMPGAGAIVAAVTAAAGVQPTVMGKPGLGLAEVLASSTGVTAGQTMFVGDRLTTDVVMGAAAGMITVLVMTGCTTAEELQEARACAAGAGGRNGVTGGRPGDSNGSGEVVLPDHVLADLTELPALLDHLLR